MVIRNCFSEKKLPLTKTSRIRSLTCFKHQTNMNVAPIFVGISLVSESSTKNSFQKLDTMRLLKIYICFIHPPEPNTHFFRPKVQDIKTILVASRAREFLGLEKFCFCSLEKVMLKKRKSCITLQKSHSLHVLFFQILSFPVLLFAHLSNTATPFCDRVLMLKYKTV